MDRVEQAQRLAMLIATELLAVQSEMAQLQRHEADLRAKLAQVLENRGAYIADSVSGNVPVYAGVDLAWNQWVDQRRAAINTELAQVLARQDGCRAKLKRAFGRDQAIQALTKKLTDNRISARNRQSAYES